MVEKFKFYGLMLFSFVWIMHQYEMISSAAYFRFKLIILSLS